MSFSWCCNRLVLEYAISTYGHVLKRIEVENSDTDNKWWLMSFNRSYRRLHVLTLKTNIFHTKFAKKTNQRNYLRCIGTKLNPKKIWTKSTRINSNTKASSFKIETTKMLVNRTPNIICNSFPNVIAW